MSLKSIFESIVSEGWNPETGSVSDFTPIPDGDYTGGIKELKYASHDKGESVSVIITADNDGKDVSPRHMMYVSNTLEQDWEVTGAKKLIKSLSKIAHMVGIELDEESFEDLEVLVDDLTDAIGEEVTISLETRFNKKKKKDEQQSDLLFPEVEYEYVDEDDEGDEGDGDENKFSRDPEDEEDNDEDEESEEDKKAAEKAKKAEARKKKLADKKAKEKAEKEAAEKAAAEKAASDEDEGEGEEGDYSKEELNDMKLAELREIAEAEYGLEIDGLKKKQLIDAILAEA